jgi:acyl dehydratase
VAVDEHLLHTLEEEVGVEYTEDLGVIAPVLTMRYAAAVGDLNPLYTDPAYARARGFADVVAPPNFLPGVINWSAGAPYDELREDGTEANTHLPGVPATGVRVMGGGEEMTFLAPLVAGTAVRRTTVLADVTMRDSRGGPMLVCHYRDEYADDLGTPLLSSVRTVLLR